MIYSSKDVGFISIGGIDIATFLTDPAPLKVSALLDDLTGFKALFPTLVFANINQATLTLKGLFDDAANGVNAACQGKGGTSQVLSYAIGSALGDPAYAAAGGFTSDYGVEPTLEKITRAGGAIMISGKVDAGIIVYPKTVKVAAWTGTAVDNAASSANGASATLQVDETLALGGYTNWIVKVQHSADNSTWADLITFTALTTGPKAERLTVAGTVNRYTRVVGALTGSGASPSITPAVILARS